MIRFTISPYRLILSALCILSIVNFDSALATAGSASHIKLQRKKVCRTSNCKSAAYSILQNMDQKVDPCDNFYEFVCGNFTKNAVLQEDQSVNNLFIQMNNKMQEQLKQSYENGISQSDPESFKSLLSFYNACLNEEQAENNSEKELLEILQKLGGWPVLVGASWTESTFDWLETMNEFRKSGFSFYQFVSFGVTVDMKNNTKKLLELDQAALGIPQTYLSQGSDQKVVKAYLKYMVDIAMIFGVDGKQAENELSESLNFEIELAKISLSPSERRDPTKLYNVMTIEQLQNQYPLAPWLTYFNNILSPHVHVDADEEINVTTPDFLKNLTNLLERTPKRVQANYAFWRIIKESAGQLSKRVRQAQNEFAASMTGNVVQKPKWQACVAQVNSRFHLVSGALFVRNYIDKNAKTSALEIVHKIRESFRKMLTEVDWMDENTKVEALKKLDGIKPLVAYPDELLDDDKVNEYYKDLKVYPESYLKSVLSHNLFDMEKVFKQFRQPFLKYHWTGLFGEAAVVNAFYNPQENTIQLPAGILQDAFFNSNNPKYMNYAGMGTFVGHEMTHGFDDNGSRFDKNGYLINWWDPKTKKEYLKRAQCIVDQYSNYTAEQVGLKLDGKHAQGENIADNGGIKEAYYAYSEFEKLNGPEPRLPGLESYTPKQTFWIANAHMWCTKYRPEYLKNLILTDPHTPDEYRVIGPMSNMPDFSKDFKCPIGSTMNPIKKCTVW